MYGRYIKLLMNKDACFAEMPRTQIAQMMHQVYALLRTTLKVFVIIVK